MLKIGFLCSADFGLDLLQFIIESSIAEVCCVWSNPDKQRGRSQKKVSNQIVSYCRSNSIPCYQPIDFKEEKEQQIKLVRQHNLDLLFVVAYGHILPKDFFCATEYGSVNVHFSLLPKYRGASPVQSCLLAGEKTTGVTIQKITSKLDAGDIILQEKFLIENQNSIQVFQKSFIVVKKMIKNFFANYKILLQNALPQENSQATFCYKIKKEDGFVSCNDEYQMVKNKFLAYYAWPKTFFIIENISYQIEEIDFNFNSSKLPKNLLTGFLYFIEKKLLLVLQDGVINITKVKKSGKKITSAVDFYNGCKISFPVQIAMTSNR